MSPYTESQPYKLGLLYKTLGELFMNPETDLRRLAEACESLGFKFGIEIIPVEDSPLNGEPVPPPLDARFCGAA